MYIDIKRSSQTEAQKVQVNSNGDIQRKIREDAKKGEGGMVLVGIETSATALVSLSVSWCFAQSTTPDYIRADRNNVIQLVIDVMQ